MKIRNKEAPLLPLLLGGAVVILLGTSGAPVVMAWVSVSTEGADAILAQESIPALQARPDDSVARSRPESANAVAHTRRVRSECDECGIVVSAREVDQSGAEDGEKKGSRDETPEKMDKSYEVTVRMNDGTNRVFTHPQPSNWRPGERVIFIGGAGQSSD